jgi:hypothetical protein
VQHGFAILDALSHASYLDLDNYVDESAKELNENMDLLLKRI